jgi:hypothetical protein
VTAIPHGPTDTPPILEAVRRRSHLGCSAAGHPALWWVLDPDDDVTCLRTLFGLHDLGTGVIVCHPRPTATWPVLVADLLAALGKHPRALSRERRTAHGRALLQVWLRAERTRHLVVLRTHQLGADLLGRLADLAETAGITLWLVWHHRDRPPLPYPALCWDAAVSALRADRGSGGHPPVAEDVIYIDAYSAARLAARQWRPDGHRLGWKVPWWNHAWPGCDVGALLQRLTIDAASTTELRARLRAAQDGFAIEGRRLTLPDLNPNELAELGPRLAPTATPTTPPTRSGCSPAGTGSPNAPGPSCALRCTPTDNPRRDNRCSLHPAGAGSAPSASHT